MRRILIALIVFVSAAPLHAQGRKVTVRWFGQSYFQVVSSTGTRIVFDPHAIMSYPRQTNEADVVLISHPHQDHNQIDVITNRERAKILVGCKGMGRKMEWNVVDEKVKDVVIRSVGVYHDKAQGMERGKNAVFIVEVDGLRIAHLGDIGHTLSAGQIKAIGEIDVLMLPVGGVYTLNGIDAKKVVEQLRPKRFILPMHYATSVFDEVVSPDEFLEDQKNVDKLLMSNEFQIDPDAKMNAPRIVMLGWRKGG
jgi:L-ascorbate metabolism protein UlaG (beta-lactamase superfamily)